MALWPESNPGLIGGRGVIHHHANPTPRKCPWTLLRESEFLPVRYGFQFVPSQRPKPSHMRLHLMPQERSSLEATQERSGNKFIRNAPERKKVNPQVGKKWEQRMILNLAQLIDKMCKRPIQWTPTQITENQLTLSFSKFNIHPI